MEVTHLLQSLRQWPWWLEQPYEVPIIPFRELGVLLLMPRRIRGAAGHPWHAFFLYDSIPTHVSTDYYITSASFALSF